MQGGKREKQRGGSGCSAEPGSGPEGESGGWIGNWEGNRKGRRPGWRLRSGEGGGLQGADEGGLPCGERVAVADHLDHEGHECG